MKIMKIIIVIMIMMIKIIKITTSKGRISLYKSLYMPCCLFEPTLRTWLLKRTFLTKLTNINTYLSMQFKFIYLTNCLIGTSTEQN